MAKKPTGSKQRQNTRPDVSGEALNPPETLGTEPVDAAPTASTLSEASKGSKSSPDANAPARAQTKIAPPKSSRTTAPKRAKAPKKPEAATPPTPTPSEQKKPARNTLPDTKALAAPSETPPHTETPLVSATESAALKMPPEPIALIDQGLTTPESVMPLPESPTAPNPTNERWEQPVPAELPNATEPEPLAGPEPQPAPEPAPPARPSLFIVHITPELAGVAKVGGLADVVFGLSRELAIRGNHVEIILPKYASMRYDQIHDLHEVYKDLWVPWYGAAIHCTVYFGFVHGRKCFFIEPHSQDNFFNRPSIYGFKDDILRYAFFSRAAMEFLWKSGKHPDIIHCHDWQTSLVPVFLYEFYQPMGMTHPRVCLTIHNFAHQGVTGLEVLTATGLHRPEHFLDQTRMGDKRYRQALNLLKGGIVYSNFVTTVSPRYAYETKDQGQGFGLEPTLHTHHIKYGGVINGIDYDVWNPEIDRHIPVQYGLDSIERKYDNKRALRHRLMLAENEKAIVAFIGRLDPQKGLDLVRHAIFHTLERGAQFVLLGSSPDERINADFWGLKQMLNDSPDCHLEIGFDEDLSHLIYAGADMMLVPSRFEPCGLTQLIALRYGTIPVVRAVGGLADTVFDKDYSPRPLHERNGYVFKDYDNPGLESALGRAIACYNDFPTHFRELMVNAMRSDYSWNIPGQDYLNIYDYIRDA
ncbi:glycogen synthase [Thiorhodococcus fuscus]|uniref:Glycogen synthase n=1 Tax=Thiorhodococcus fuscus TaxID=527200 RepID=A0ABW4YCH4_9GAMM